MTSFQRSTALSSPRLTARMAGLFYLLQFAFAPGMYAMRTVVVPTDAAATASRILAHQGLFQLGFAGNVIATASYLVVTALFYVLFRPVNKAVSLIASFFSLVGCTLIAVGNVFYLAPTVVFKGMSTTTALQTDQLTLMFLKLYGLAFNTSLVFFAFYCLTIGCLILRSSFLPRILGGGMVLAGLGWLTFLSPSFSRVLIPYVMVAGIGEAALMIWLLTKGVDAHRWNQQAVAASSRIG